MSNHTPQQIVDAIQEMAAYLRREGYAECIISETGGASFRLISIFEEYHISKEENQMKKFLRIVLKREFFGFIVGAACVFTAQEVAGPVAGALVALLLVLGGLWLARKFGS